MSLVARIREHIHADGPLTVAAYMERCLSYYYHRRDPLGAKGDFITAPEISQIFGELVGLWCSVCWQRMGRPRAALVELGPGRGTLMCDALRATAQVPGFHDNISVHLVEISQSLKARQQEMLRGLHPLLRWHERVEELPDLPLLLIANEFFDALPIHQWMRTQEGWAKRHIGFEQERFLFQDIPSAFPPPLPYPLPDVPAGALVETCEPALALMHRLGQHLRAHGGALLVVDYGYAQGTCADTLQAVRNHAYASVLETPGEIDLTAHVDFRALAAAAKQEGLAVYGPVGQGNFLRALGAEVRAAQLVNHASEPQRRAVLSGLERLLSPTQMGTLFQVMAICAPTMPPPEGFAG